MFRKEHILIQIGHLPSINLNFLKPFDFDPDRWEKPEYKDKEQLVSVIFSGRPRSCIDKSLALTEIKVMMIKIIAEI